MQLPTVAKILGRTYSIQYSDLDECSGLCDLNNKIIFVDLKQQSQQEIRATILHETVHGILHESGLNNLFDNTDIEEAFVRAMEHGLEYQFKLRGKNSIYSKYKQFNTKTNKETKHEET